MRDALPALAPAAPPAEKAVEKAAPPAEKAAPPAEKAAPSPPSEPPKPDVTPALSLLSLLQREGRFIDFVQQDVTGFTDADVGAAARVVHEGCRKALHQSSKITALRTEEEGTSVTIAEGYSANEVKLMGNLTGKPPYRGKLQHRGWRVKDLVLPAPTKHHDASVVAAAEVEL